MDETYGIIVYQDQVLLILQQFAGYTLGEADIVRKAMGKKIPSLMAQERDRFVAGAAAKGFDAKLSTDIFDLIEPFAGYAFNKAHSVSYAMISYWTAYFKAHYPVEYMASVLNSRLDHPDKVVSSINECFRLGIPVLLPDINRSEEFFTIDKESGADPCLRIGLAAIKTVGESAVRPLVAERKQNGPYRSIDDYCRRADSRGLNRRTLESLVRAGAFDSLGPAVLFWASWTKLLPLHRWSPAGGRPASPACSTIRPKLAMGPSRPASSSATLMHPPRKELHGSVSCWECPYPTTPCGPSLRWTPRSDELVGPARRGNAGPDSNPGGPRFRRR